MLQLCSWKWHRQWSSYQSYFANTTRHRLPSSPQSSPHVSPYSYLYSFALTTTLDPSLKSGPHHHSSLFPPTWPSSSLQSLPFDLTLTIIPVSSLQIFPRHPSWLPPQPRPHHHFCPFHSDLPSPSPLTVLPSPSLRSLPAALSLSLLSPPAALFSPPPHHRQTSPPCLDRRHGSWDTRRPGGLWRASSRKEKIGQIND